MNRLTHPENTTILPVLLVLTLVCFALSPQARAVCQEGCDTATANTFLGEDALIHNPFTGTSNTAVGAFALTSNTGGAANTAIGTVALFSNTIGSDNTATGVWALRENTTGNFNTATGQNALFGNTIGSNNTAMGYNAGFNLTTGSYNIDIGNQGVAGESGIIRIGTAGTQTATFIAAIRDVPIAGHKVVGVDANGQLGNKTSSARFKEAIKPMGKASEAILSFQPVSFRYKKALDPKGTPEFGLIAEEVAKVAPELVDADSQGKPFSVRYDEVNAMLLNEFLKEHRKGEQQDRKIEKLEATITKQQEQIEALTAGLQKVSAQLELSKASPRTVLNNQ
jgi:hypothetical protein